MIDLCNATITVLLDADEAECQSLTCEHPSSSLHVNHHSRGVSWRDTSPGATPHHDPSPTYRACSLPAGAWGVMERTETVAYFSGFTHPDPQGAASREAARLNAETQP